MKAHNPAELRPGLIGGVTTLAKNLFGLLLNRLELAALELSEARADLVKIAVLFALGVMAVWFAMTYWVLLVVFLAWSRIGWLILPLMASVFTLLAIGMFWYARSILARGKLSMPATMAELRGDRDALL